MIELTQYSGQFKVRYGINAVSQIVEWYQGDYNVHFRVRANWMFVVAEADTEAADFLIEEDKLARFFRTLVLLRTHLSDCLPSVRQAIAVHPDRPLLQIRQGNQIAVLRPCEFNRLTAARNLEEIIGVGHSQRRKGPSSS
jgi:hypothetical protein